jgi:hypothetical protein
LERSLDQEAKDSLDPATRDLCFLFAQLAEQIHLGTADWQSNPFLFRAFKIGIAELLDALEPTGKVKIPPKLLAALTHKFFTGRFEQAVKSPAKYARRAVDVVLWGLRKGADDAPKISKIIKEIPDTDLKQTMQRLESTAYRMGNVKSRLTINEKGMRTRKVK